MSLRHWVQDALRSLWADIPRARDDERATLVTWLHETCAAEQRLAVQLRRDAAAMPYEHFRRRLEEMADQDEQHAHLLQTRMQALFSPLSPPAERRQGEEAVAANTRPRPPWQGLRHLLANKRELYERYRQLANVFEDTDLRALLRQLLHEEEVHQDQLVELIIKVDSHVHTS